MTQIKMPAGKAGKVETYNNQNNSISHDVLLAPLKPMPLKVNFNNIPLSLRDKCIFVMWRYVLKNGKWTKPLYQVNGQYAKTNDQNTWASYDNVKTAYEKGGFDGIGIVLTGEVVGIDLDHVISDFEIEPWAQEIITQFKDTYIELSPGGDGLHILTTGISRFTGKRHESKRLEVYDHSSPRYFTITGQLYDAGHTELTNTQDELDWLASKYDVKSDAPLLEYQPQIESRQDADSIMQAILNSKSKDKFNALNSGNITNDHSADDLAFCNLIAYFTTDKAIIDSIFRKSPFRMRGKWDEKHSADGKTYAEMTINKAITGNSAQAGTGSRAKYNPINDYLDADHIEPSTYELEPFCDDLLRLPHGLGIIQDYVFNQMKYPSRATAAVAAIATMSLFSMDKITVKSFNGLGLNEQYVVLAPTGFGKEDLRNAIQKLYKSVTDDMTLGNLAGLNNPVIQYSMAASPQGLHDQLEENNAQFFMADEFAEWLTQASTDSHKQAALGYCMEIYTKALSFINVPRSAIKPRASVKNPRVTIFATSTAERMLEAMTSSQSDSGAHNRIVFFVAEQERITKKYHGQEYEPSEQCLNVIRYATSQNESEVTFDADAWSYFTDHDLNVIEPLKFSDNRLAGRLSEQAIKLAALIAISDKRLKIAVNDLVIAYKIRENLYRRFNALLQKNGGINEMHITGKAVDQLKIAFRKHEYIVIGQLNKHSRAYKNLSTRDQESVKSALINQGIVKLEGIRLYSNLKARQI